MILVGVCHLFLVLALKIGHAGVSLQAARSRKLLQQTIVIYISVSLSRVILSSCSVY